MSQIALLVLAVLAALIGLLDMNAAVIGLYLTLLFGGIAWVFAATWAIERVETSAGLTSGASSKSILNPSESR